MSNGPDPAGGVALALNTTFYLRLESAIASRGDCRTDNRSQSVTCTLGQIPAGTTMIIVVKAFGPYASQATITALDSVDNNDTEPGDNVSTTQVLVN